jgi:hypothetical protein
MDKIKCQVVGQIYGNDGKPLPLGSIVSVGPDQVRRLKGRVEPITEAEPEGEELLVNLQKELAPAKSEPEPEPVPEPTASDIAGQAPAPAPAEGNPAPWAAPASAPEKGGKK